MERCCAQEFIEAMSSWYFDGKAMLTDEEFENLREVRSQHFRQGRGPILQCLQPAG